MPQILIVDDSVSVRKALERILKTRKMEVVAAKSAEDALETLRNLSPDLIIADVIMPGLSGFELCESIKTGGAHTDTPVMLISGVVDGEVERKAQEAGALSVVKKPFTPDDIFPKIEAALGAARADTPAPITEAVEEAAPAPAQGQPGGLETHLQPFMDKQEILAAMLVTRQGESLVELGDSSVSSDVLGSYCAFMLSGATALGAHVGAESLEGFFLEYDKQALYLSRVDRDTSLVLRLKDAGALNVVRYLLRKQLPEITGALNLQTA